MEYSVVVVVYCAIGTGDDYGASGGVVNEATVMVAVDTYTAVFRLG